MNEIRRALLGDRAAQEALTVRGVLLPCPLCGKTDVSITCEKRLWWDHWVYCTGCGMSGPVHETHPKAIKAWNTRAPILSAEELEAINGKL